MRLMNKPPKATKPLYFVTAAERAQLLSWLSHAQRILEANARKASARRPSLDRRTAKRLNDLADRVNTIRVEIYDMTDGDLG